MQTIKFLGLCGVVAAGLASAPALAAPSVYSIDKFGGFGTVDLANGKRTDISATDIMSPAGLAVGPGNTLYTAGDGNNNFYQIDEATGGQNLVSVGGGVIYEALGSLGTTIYTISSGGELFRVDPLAGTVADVGATGITKRFGNAKFGLSVGGDRLLAVSADGLYGLDTSTGAASRIGNAGTQNDVNALLSLDGTLYGSTNPSSLILTLDPGTGAELASLMTPQNGPGGVTTIFGLAPIPSAVAAVPEPGGWPMLITAALALFGLARFRRA